MTTKHHARWLMLPMGAAMLALGACAPSGEEPGPVIADNGGVEAAQAEAAGNVAPVIAPVGNVTTAADGAAGATMDGDGSALVLAALTPDDLAGAALPGELGCSFGPDARAQPILIAKGDVASADPARGIIRVGDTIETIAAPGGFDAMTGGTTFAANGFTLRVAPTGPAQGGGESPPRPATLTADRADGARRVFDGVWQCGP